jgi:hypothetical protein
MIRIWTFDLGGRALGDGKKFLDRAPATAVLEPLVAFPQSLLDGMSNGFTGRFGNGLCQMVCLRVLDTQACPSFFL